MARRRVRPFRRRYVRRPFRRARPYGRRRIYRRRFKRKMAILTNPRSMWRRLSYRFVGTLTTASIPVSRYIAAGSSAKIFRTNSPYDPEWTTGLNQQSCYMYDELAKFYNRYWCPNSLITVKFHAVNHVNCAVRLFDTTNALPNQADDIVEQRKDIRGPKMLTGTKNACVIKHWFNQRNHWDRQSDVRSWGAVTNKVPVLESFFVPMVWNADPADVTDHPVTIEVTITYLTKFFDSNDDFIDAGVADVNPGIEDVDPSGEN